MFENVKRTAEKGSCTKEGQAEVAMGTVGAVDE